MIYWQDNKDNWVVKGDNIKFILYYIIIILTVFFSTIQKVKSNCKIASYVLLDIENLSYRRFISAVYN